MYGRTGKNGNIPCSEITTPQTCSASSSPPRTPLRRTALRTHKDTEQTARRKRATESIAERRAPAASSPGRELLRAGAERRTRRRSEPHGGRAAPGRPLLPPGGHGARRPRAAHLPGPAGSPAAARPPAPTHLAAARTAAPLPAPRGRRAAPGGGPSHPVLAAGGSRPRRRPLRAHGAAGASPRRGAHRPLGGGAGTGPPLAGLRLRAGPFPAVAGGRGAAGRAGSGSAARRRPAGAAAAPERSAPRGSAAAATLLPRFTSWRR